MKKVKQLVREAREAVERSEAADCNSSEGRELRSAVLSLADALSKSGDVR
jgi:hypothetical protein